jgi:ATP-dependent exoDNAse (exonuclease V) alpha subunit
VEEVTGQGDLKSLAGVAGSAVENLETAAGIKSRTLASYELAWERGRDPLNQRDILVIDEAGTRQLERALAAAEKAHAKVALVGDSEQLQAIEAGAPFRGIASTHGVSNLTEVRANKSTGNAPPRRT